MSQQTRARTKAPASQSARPGAVDACPCGSGLAYAACCQRWHAGGEPPTPEALMRSRYAAFARCDYPYLWRTLHPRHEDKQADRARWLASVRRSSASLRFEGLRVCGTRGPDTEGLGHVLFHATISESGIDRSFAEHSRFALDGGAWRYLDGTMLEWQDPGDLTFDSFWKVALR